MARWVWCLCLVIGSAQTAAADPSREFLAFIRAQAAGLRAQDQAPKSADEWLAHKAKLRERLVEAWGGFPTEPCPLEPRSLGELQRDGYRVEKLVLQTLPGLWMTSLVYVPEGPGPFPAILQVHGHWAGAKQDPVVQARCIGAAKHGFVVLAVDALGAGERGLKSALGEYHGEMVAATLFPTGRPLAGLQVYENMRAVDYLQSRKDVIADQIGITGASGGGNQTMYAGAFDERFRGVVPVCSVGNYQAYLGAACCMCEVVPGALKFTEERDVLGLTAPRGLMVVSATRDAPQFSVAEAAKSVAGAGEIYSALQHPKQLKHAIFDSPHDYNQAMREAMYGWMTLQLKGVGEGDPLPDPALTLEMPEALRCYPGDARPDDWLTLPQFAAREGRRLVAAQPAPGTAEDWIPLRKELQGRLIRNVLGGFPANAELALSTREVANGQTELTFQPEAGITLTAQKVGEQGPVWIVLDLDGGAAARQRPFYAQLQKSGATVVTLDLRATGGLAWPGDKIGRAPDHNTAEWSLWIGRPLLGQWAYDVRRLVDALGVPQVNVAGFGPAGLVALTAAATDDRIGAVLTSASLASYVHNGPYDGPRLGTIAPGILRDVGDVSQLAALVAPRPLVIERGVSGGNTPLTAEELGNAYAAASRVYRLLGAEGQLRLGEEHAATLLPAGAK